MSTKQMPKVVFVVGTLGVGGAERQLFYMCKALIDAGGAPEAILLTKGEHWERQLKELGVQVHWVGSVPFRSVRAVRIAFLVRSLRPDIVQSAHFYTNLYAVVAARAAHARDIGAIRSDTMQVVKGLGRWGRLTLKLPRMLAVNSTRAREQAMALGVPSERLFYLPSVVDTATFTPAHRCAEGTFVVLNIGRMIPAKRHDRFLRVLRRLIDQAPPGLTVKGRIIGTGTERDEIVALAEALGFQSGQLELLQGSDTLPAYQAADTFLLTSDYEGTPNVILEAMASGLPVVSGDVGEVAALIDDGRTGYVVPAGDEDAMVAALFGLASNPALRREFGAEALRRTRENWSTEALRESLGRLYELARGVV